MNVYLSSIAISESDELNDQTVVWTVQLDFCVSVTNKDKMQLKMYQNLQNWYANHIQYFKTALNEYKKAKYVF